MKNRYTLQKWAFGFCFLFSVFSFNVFGQVGIGTTEPNPNALLDIDASTTPGGLLLPRVNLTATNLAAPLASNVPGMVVYNTAEAGVAPNAVRPGYYYNDGGGWVRVNEGGSTAKIAFENTTFLDIPLFINSDNGNPTAALIYSTTINLAKPTLVEIKTHFDVDITRFNWPNPVVTGRPILYSMLLMEGTLATGTPIINDSKSFTSTSAGNYGNTYYSGSYSLGGSGYVNLAAGEHTFNLYVLGAGGGSQGFDITYSNTNDARFQIIYHD